MNAVEKAEFFDIQSDVAVIKDWLKEGIDWGVADVREPAILDQMGLQDIVVASNFLCHMERSEARAMPAKYWPAWLMLRAFIFVSGVDLDIRQKVARDLGWQPVDELLEADP